ncbi:MULTISPECIES: ABC transporter ATP-binding protein [Exiguobacterium]|uniref:ABC transporter ATP-binding protein n=1 Tax=Exiguobacterium TaxID=33986 RepID=UPI0008777D2E|nr:MULTISPECIES: ABC transporter ATP-binding protein [Exiguobacterium]TCI39195.1 ABC transporter ATP-binding protein [Exiguobacterium sp. SH4S7]TCI48119.1 ABC transporter ATP-binding protein [Exiguobacterium sp. SH5S32]TCI55004.1 ABC transporter ATP-binding protein [Exiguobacterium sp. SH1S4]TCI63015.1 ABC transporter ATP-binding protein [Exiguobacterium sp. SH0S2]TCI74798.1 ABC transporter ATP-binding protein [Exiguobacterium sp. SH1S1]
MIRIENVNKIYKTGDIETAALKDVDLTINDGAFVVILGPSGSGKSTLLNVISGLDTVTSGNITFDDTVLTDLSPEQMTAFRRDHLGFIFQQYNLLQNLTVYENIQIGADLSTQPLGIDELLEQVGLSPARDKYPYQLSGGEQQRVSVARSLAKNPSIIFCDEPTGSLDEDNSKKVLELLERLNTTYGKTVVVITHNTGISAMADDVIKMNSGRIVELTHNPVRQAARDIAWG